MAVSPSGPDTTIHSTIRMAWPRGPTISSLSRCTKYPRFWDANPALAPAGAAPSVLDMFRCSAGSSSFTYGVATSFSIGGCATPLANFNAGSSGDTGDWDNSNPADAANAYLNSGQKTGLTTADITALDVIGWNTMALVAGSTTTSGGPAGRTRSKHDLAGTGMPEPGGLAVFGLVLAVLVTLSRGTGNQAPQPLT